MELSDSLKILQWHMWDLWREASRQSGSGELSSSELDYLYALISSKKGMRLTELAGVMKVSKASASTMAVKLEKKGYIHKIPCPEDGRASLLQATDRTMALAVEEDRIYRKTAKDIAQILDPKALAELSDILGRVCSVIAEKKVEGK
ncbi:MarR family protein [Desulfobotulus alkaliphilus]|uniref:MarR family protein n=1 Tax=Desulfobotulus alkaliphilus TaxID=622671 RepID=A0A562S8J3_9BACT|nr:MarR family transcriptional regulator [Desulfobotulus alkaliphilus]TWI76760.1 MarR family protein [Desulfobotulus alkaliphilus]